MNGNKESFGVLITFSCERLSSFTNVLSHQSFVSNKDGLSGGYFQPEKRELNLVQEILLNYSIILFHGIKDTNFFFAQHQAGPKPIMTTTTPSKS